MQSSRPSDSTASGGPPETVPAAFAAAAAAAPSAPLITWYDDGTGERTELSGVTLANWVAKTANLLVDGCGLGPGDTAAVAAPPHWQTAAVLLGCWSAGLAVDYELGGDAPGRDVPGGDGRGRLGAPVEVVFAAADRLAGQDGRAAEVFGLALAPLAAPMVARPPGVADYVIEVRGHGDQFTPYRQLDADALATTTTSHTQLCRAAAQRAAALGIGAGDRVLIDAAAHLDPAAWLVAPLVAGASVILCGNLDPARVADRVATERATVVLA